MKELVYKIGGYISVYNPETGKVEQKECLAEVSVPYTEVAYQEALVAAHNGEYTIEDDGVEPSLTEKITELKNQLSATDYKVIKCAECQLLGEEMPYDVTALHEERQILRDKINLLE